MPKSKVYKNLTARQLINDLKNILGDTGGLDTPITGDIQQPKLIWEIEPFEYYSKKS